ncbi:MAG: protein translocase subunit SecD [Verrucomicrobiae bacterium]|nr:protein translocase subunit SecD [Verrucomicrobiae bacterium]
MQTSLLFFGGLLFLILFIWYLAATERRMRLGVGLALWLTLFALCAVSVYPPKETVRLGLDLKGGTSFLIELDGNPTPDALQQAVAVIRKRIDKFGVAEPLIQPAGEKRIMVQIPGLSAADKNTARSQLEKVARLEFRLVHPNNNNEIEKIEKGAPVPANYELKELKDMQAGKEVTSKLLVKRRVELSGNLVARAFRYIQPTGESAVSIEFKSEGKEIFGKLTEAHVGERLAIVLDGEVKSAPAIRQPIYGGSAEISGNFTPQEAEELASVLENPLETPVQIIEERGVDPSLGRDSIRSGILAACYGAAAVILFMLIYYRFLGVIAVCALLINLLILFGLLAQFHFTLTLPGIAGIILTLGMAVDANVLIYERIREEMAAGKPISAAITSGFDKAFSSILDANVTTIITSAILFWQGSGAVQGFAVTLTLGILGTLFAALIITRNLLEWKDVKTGYQKLTIMQFVKRPNFNFMKYRFLAFALSGIVLIAGMGAFVMKGNDVYSVDFTGGEALTLSYSQKQNVGQLRASLEKAGIQDAVLQSQKSPDGQHEALLVKTQFGQGDQAEKVLLEQFPQAGFSRISLDKVGPVVGTELKNKSAFALLLALLGILIYVTIRFEFSFAIGAIVALLHDVLITVGVFALTDHKLSLTVVGAVLAIAGYSINDTIVVFDRIRESLRLSEKGSLMTLIDRALNATLSRTLLTSGTTLLSVIALFIFGGPVIHDFAFALLIGIAAGTYSSLYIASPIVLWWTGNRTEWLKSQVAPAKA